MRAPLWLGQTNKKVPKSYWENETVREEPYSISSVVFFVKKEMFVLLKSTGYS